MTVAAVFVLRVTVTAAKTKEIAVEEVDAPTAAAAPPVEGELLIGASSLAAVTPRGATAVAAMDHADPPRG